jgi:hypothetical protein
MPRGSFCDSVRSRDEREDIRMERNERVICFGMGYGDFDCIESCMEMSLLIIVLTGFGNKNYKMFQQNRDCEQN